MRSLIISLFLISLAFGAYSSDSINWNDINTSAKLSNVDDNEFKTLTGSTMANFGHLKICDGFKSSQIANIKPEIFKSMLNSCFAQLGSSCEGFYYDQVVKLPDSVFGSLSSACAKSFSAEAPPSSSSSSSSTTETDVNGQCGCRGIGDTNGLGFSYIKKEVIPFFTDDCVMFFGEKVFEKASASQIQAFSNSQCGSFLMWHVATMSKEAVEGLTIDCASHFSGYNEEVTFPACQGINKTNWGWFKDDIIGTFGPKCIQVVDNAAFSNATVDSIKAINSQSCSGFSRVLLEMMKKTASAGFSLDCFNNVHASNFENFREGFEYFSDDVCKNMRPDLIDDLVQNGSAAFKYFTADCLAEWPSAAYEKIAYTAVERTVNFEGYCGHMDVIFDEMIDKLKTLSYHVDFDDYLSVIETPVQKIALPKCYDSLKPTFTPQFTVPFAANFKLIDAIHLAYVDPLDFAKLEDISIINSQNKVGLRDVHAFNIKGTALAPLSDLDLPHMQYNFFAGVGPWQVNHLGDIVVQGLFQLPQKNLQNEDIYPIFYLPASSISALTKTQLVAVFQTKGPVKNMCKEQLNALTLTQLSWLSTEVRNEIKTRMTTAKTCPTNTYKFIEPKEKKGKKSPILFIVTGVVAIAVIAFVAVLIMKKSKKNNPAADYLITPVDLYGNKK
eukprot:TRINITY_DN3503_c0_g1_i1.p1 TRINITY_DN3503_c0_g1~~TRINITY_DN3503_c0_g1_i1.p1  ORF type:complete len:669 (-),score=173.63 TRINITY_DN3503_c0_g1_i1:257-2263(-)